MAAPAEHVETSDPPEMDPEPEAPETSEPETSDREQKEEEEEKEKEKEEDDDEDDEEGPQEPIIRDTPADIKLEAIANTVALHPTRDLLVCGDVDGDLYAYAYSCTEGETRELWSSGHHLKSCRQVRVCCY